MLKYPNKICSQRSNDPSPHQVQYQVTCRSTTPHQMCLWLQAFVDTCTKDILGKMLQIIMRRNKHISGHCFTRAGVSFISSKQLIQIERTGIGKECERQSVGSYHRTILQKKERPLQLAYSDYLKSVLSQLRQRHKTVKPTKVKLPENVPGEIFSKNPRDCKYYCIALNYLVTCLLDIPKGTKNAVSFSKISCVQF